MLRIAPSILAADFLRLGEQIREAESAGADRFHIDIMDGLFVPNISLGLPVVEAIRPATTRPLEAHLMIERPERYIAAFVAAGANTVIVHQEHGVHLHRTIQEVLRLGAKAGVAINPATPAELLSEVIEMLDLVLVMTVNPGFGGQKFIRETLPKIGRVKEMIRLRNAECELEVDGGIDRASIADVVAAGATVAVAGTSLFRAEGGPASGMRALIAVASGDQSVSG